jgi:CRISPR-associated protein Cas5h
VRIAMTNDTIPVLAMDVWSDYACFRRGYSTTSPLTYPFPPRTTISGLLGCIMGMDWNEYYSKIEHVFSRDNSLFSIQLLNPVQKIRINQNLIDTKTVSYSAVLKFQKPLEYIRTQIPFEYLKDPKYRIFVWLRDETSFNRLREMIRSHKSVYTPYLGLSGLIANFKYVDVFEAEKMEAKDKTPIVSVVKAEYKIEVEEGKEYLRIRVPSTMKSDRSLSGTVDLIYEKNGKPIIITSGEYYSLKGYGNIVLF